MSQWQMKPMADRGGASRTHKQQGNFSWRTEGFYEISRLFHLRTGASAGHHAGRLWECVSSSPERGQPHQSLKSAKSDEYAGAGGYRKISGVYPASERQRPDAPGYRRTGTPLVRRDESQLSRLLRSTQRNILAADAPEWQMGDYGHGCCAG